MHWKFLPSSLFAKSYGCNAHFCGLNSLSTYMCKLWLEAILFFSVRETAAAADFSVFTYFGISTYFGFPKVYFWRYCAIPLLFGRTPCLLNIAACFLNLAE